jgi:hypothetical protein
LKRETAPLEPVPKARRQKAQEQVRIDRSHGGKQVAEPAASRVHSA